MFLELGISQVWQVLPVSFSTLTYSETDKNISPLFSSLVRNGDGSVRFLNAASLLGCAEDFFEQCPSSKTFHKF